MEGSELSGELVARSHEMNILKTRLEKAIAGSGGTLLISGEAGIGKTRLAMELLGYAKSRKVKILSGRAVPHNFTPYLVFVDALEDMFAIEPKDASPTRLRKITQAIRRVAPEIIEVMPVIGDVMKVGRVAIREYKEFKMEPMARKQQLLDSVTHLILKISTSQPILIILDDLQWADPSSFGLLHYLARNMRSAHALILGTYRIEELEEQVGGKPTLLDTLRFMRSEDLVEEITLGRLGKTEVKTLLNALLYGDAPEQLVNAIYLGTEGNPLFIIETLKLLVEDKVLVRVDGSWTLSKPIERVTIPGRVR